jgi:hypothetical protein
MQLDRIAEAAIKAFGHHLEAARGESPFENAF